MFFRLLAAATLLCAVPTLAQVQPGNPSSATPAMGQFQTSPYLQLNIDQPNSAPEEPGAAMGQPEKGLAGRLDPKQAPVPDLGEISWQTDASCFTIRSYRVVRDDPHYSDSTHRDGSTTCVPASRFRVYMAGERR